ncbi:hypothetical protein [Deinococcus sp. JMULE3]|uniref:hypothetical protein n=1 Tax=Deinococcus sp. JMULE3 TaxID=2518341 RepID=UPI001576C48F|nr:hypothetical protein [Deinococcus sp. JMULE3]
MTIRVTVRVGIAVGLVVGGRRHGRGDRLGGTWGGLGFRNRGADGRGRDLLRRGGGGVGWRG